MLEQGEVVSLDEQYVYIKSYMYHDVIYRAKGNYAIGNKLLYAVLLDGNIQVLCKIEGA